ncbi:hypothetical protein LBMAG53_32160 [Planctomycetota bacterium]|nr:hypothetical protein LBMAG53_32160 [Planctomycetota bacterium]
MDCVTGCFGKLPTHGDFLRLAPDDAPSAQIDSWFLAGRIDPHRQPDRAAAFAAAAPVFALLPAANRWWAAAVFPSSDAVGRPSPFVVVAGLRASDYDDQPGLLPLLFAPFFQSAWRQHLAGWPDQPTALRQRCATLIHGIDVESAEKALLDGLGNTPQATLWAGLFGAAEDPRRAGAMTWLAQAASAVGSGQRLILQVPVAHQLHLSFWLTLVQLLGEAEPALVAMHPTGPRPTTTLAFGPPMAESGFAALWPDSSPGAFLSGFSNLLDEAGRQVVATSDPLHASLADGTASLRDLLHDLVAARRTKRYTQRTDR